MRGRRKALSGGAGLGAVALLLLKALRAGGCDWRFECGANGGRGAPTVGWKRVAVDRGGRFSAHHDRDAQAQAARSGGIGIVSITASPIVLTSVPPLAGSSATMAVLPSAFVR